MSLAALLLSITAWLGYDYSFWSIATLAFGILLAFPLVNTMTDSTNNPSDAAPAATENLSPERERVLRLLEQGKVTAEDAAELLAALAATVAPPAPVSTIEPWTAARKLSLVGASIVLIGFFLPWYTINPGREVAKLTNAMNCADAADDRERQQMSGATRRCRRCRTRGWLHLRRMAATSAFAGGDVQHGLGWLALVLGLATAGIPYVVTGLSRDARGKLSLATGTLGAIIVIYLITARPSLVAVGLPLTLIGFAVELFALYRESHPASAPQATATPALA